MSQPFKLFRLQQVDSQLDHARARLSEIEVILGDHVVLRQAQDRARDAEAALSEARKSLHYAEQDVQAQRIKMEQAEASLYGGKIRNPKELQDLQKEVASLKRYIILLEDRQLENMLAAEEAETVFKNASLDVETVQAQAAEQQAGLNEEQKMLLNRCQGLEADRQALAGSVEVDDIRLYEQLRQQRRGIAVAKVADNACSACGSILTPGHVQAAYSPTQISRCAFCGRILYAG